MRRLPALYLTTVVLAALTGCAATPHSKFYLLSPATAVNPDRPAGIAPAIGVGPVELPKYLDRPQIALRIDSYELSYSEIHRWAENLQDNVTSVLAESLARLVPTDRISRFPWERTATIDFQVAVEISRFDADKNGTVVLSANWKLYRGEGREIVVDKSTSIKETYTGAAYSDIVAAQSRALDALSHEIAAAIRKAAGLGSAG